MWWEAGFSLLNMPVTHTLLSAAILFLITSTLIRRKRIGLYAVMFFQVIGFLAGISTLTALINFAVPTELFSELSFRNPLTDIFSMLFALVFLWRARPAFPARIHRSAWLSAALVLLAGVVLTGVFTWFASESQGLPELQVFLHTIGIDPGFRPPSPHANWVLQVASTLLGITLLASSFRVLAVAREVVQRSQLDACARG